MAYYEWGYAETDRWINADTPRVGTTSGMVDYEHDGMAILHYDDPYQPGYEFYIMVGIKSGNPFSIYDPNESIASNVNDWLTRGYHETANSSLKYNQIEVTDTETYPPAVEEPTIPLDGGIDLLFGDGPIVEGYCDLHYTNLPIFKITMDDYSGFNNYISTGDDTDAENYSDLHPSVVRVDVWLSGNYPQLYIKPIMASGELKGELSVKITASPVLSPKVTLEDKLTIDTMHTYSYEQYQDAVPLVPTNYELLITDDNPYSQCYSKFSIKANGEVNDSENGITNHIQVFYHLGAPDESDYPQNNTDFNTNPSYNNNSGTNTLTKTYELDNVKLKQFGNFMWSSNFKDNVFSLVQSPLENIVSLKAMPLSGMGSTEETIKVGNVQSSITADVVVDADSKKTTVGSVKIPRIFNNFIDYSQFNIKIYLPYIGFKELDPVAVMGKTLKLYYIWDCVLGNVMAELYLQGNNDAMLLYECWQGSAGIDIAITSTNRGQIESGYVNNGISAIANLFSGNLAGAGKDVFSGLTQEFHSESNGVGNPSLLGKMDMTARVIIKRPQPFEPLEYGHVKGYPCYQYFTNKNNKGGISQLSGASSDGTPNNMFIKCSNFICSNIDYATDEEKREIKELMESGVYI